MSHLPASYVEGFHDVEAVKRMKYQPLGQTGLTVSKLSFGKVSLHLEIRQFIVQVCRGAVILF